MTEAAGGSRGGYGKKKGVLDERRREDVKAACERLRCAIRSLVDAKSQSKFLSAVDQIQQMVMRGEVDLDSLQGTIQATRGQARRSMRDRPVDMVQLINHLDAIDLEIAEFFRSIASGGAK